MKRRYLAAALLLTLPAALGWTWLQIVAPGARMTESAQAFLKTLDEEQRKTVLLPYDTPQRVGWHFIPKAERKGLQLKHMNEAQRAAADALLRSCLSAAGHGKATRILTVETLLAEHETNQQGGNIRDPERYYFTLFGEPTEKGRWGLSIEGHHLSLNFVVSEGQLVATTPQFFATNPAEIKNAILDDFPVGTRVLGREETLAFELVASLDKEQRAAAVIAEKAPAEIRAAGEPQSPQEPPVGIDADDLNVEQRTLLHALIQEYADAMPPTIAKARMAEIEEAGIQKVKFAWAGAEKPGVGHYYRVEGPTFVIELVNTQHDAAGTPANHVHALWPDPRGDFDLPVKTEE